MGARFFDNFLHTNFGTGNSYAGYASNLIFLNQKKFEYEQILNLFFRNMNKF
jgi:hypothetical protein